MTLMKLKIYKELNLNNIFKLLKFYNKKILQNKI